MHSVKEGMMRVLVTGAKGQLGKDVLKAFERVQWDCKGIDQDTCDVTVSEEVKAVIAGYRPDVVVHCAAYTAVDRAEDEREACWAVNVSGTRAVALACQSVGAAMVYISTDYVFDGTCEVPYEVTDTPHPKNYYGLTKYEGEQVVQQILDKYFILRTAWVFGNQGPNFVRTMLRIGREREEIQVVADQFGSPTYTEDLAERMVSMLQTTHYGIYHITNEGVCSWYDFAKEIFRQAGYEVAVKPIATADYITKAERPQKGVLSKACLDVIGIKRLPTWQDALKRYLKGWNGC